MIIIRNRLAGLILPGRFPALCIWPVILIRPDVSNDFHAIINHESIHARQQIEMAWIFFFAWYLVEFLIKLLLFRSFMKAYLALSFEREAYTNEHNSSYLAMRKSYAWLKYVSNKRPK